MTDAPPRPGADTAGKVEPRVVGPVFNERGPIAENYYDLQGLAVLDRIRAKHPLPRASASSLCRALFQAVEIAVLNLNDLLMRAERNLREEKIDGAVSKLFWARGFHRVLNGLAVLPARLNGIMESGSAQSVLRISDSPAFISYLATLKRLDDAVTALIETGRLDAERAIADRSLESADYNLLHLLRTCNHEATIWEANLSEVAIPCEVISYAAFVVTDAVRDCVYDRVLQGDTYFTQFRGLHQIPETLGEEANDQCEQAILDIRHGRLQRALEHLQSVTTLIDTMLIALPAMADNLATSDYHNIRENLGLTSGSHSVCLHYHMFNDLYQQLANEIVLMLAGRDASQLDAKLTSALARVDERRFDDYGAWLTHQIINEGLKIQSSIFHWRNLHLHLPRNNLGGNMTKSLTGSPEAIKAVRHMMSSARYKDLMKPLARSRGLVSGNPPTTPGPLTRYLESGDSLDNLLLSRTGAVTQSRFHDVQERLGFFANRCPFKAPPRRIASDPEQAIE